MDDSGCLGREPPFSFICLILWKGRIIDEERNNPCPARNGALWECPILGAGSKAGHLFLWFANLCTDCNPARLGQQSRSSSQKRGPLCSLHYDVSLEQILYWPRHTDADRGACFCLRFHGQFSIQYQPISEQGSC